MTILHHHRMPGHGAGGIHTEAMVQAFRKLGHEVKVMSVMPAGSGRQAEQGRRRGHVLRRLPPAPCELAETGYKLKAHPDVVRAIGAFGPDDPASLQDVLGRLARDPALRARLGEEARQGVERRRTWIGDARLVLRRRQELRDRSGEGRAR